MADVDGSIKIGAHLDLKQLEKDIKTAKKELASMEKEQAKLSKKASSQGAEYKDLQNKINYYRDLYAADKNFNSKMKSRKIDYGTDEYTAELDKFISKYESNYSKLLSNFNKVEMEYTQTADLLAAKNIDISISQGNLTKMNDVLKNSVNGVASGFRNLSSKVLTFAKNTVVSATKGISRITKSMVKAINPLNLFGKSFSMLMRTGKFMIFGKLFSAIFKTVGEGFTNLRSYSSEFDRSMNEMQSSLSYLGNSIVAAVAPALQALIPIFSSITDAIAGAVNMIAQLTARLTGNATTFIRAKKAQEGYASATDKANKSQQKQLANFDTIQKLGSSSSGENSSGGDLFEEVPIESEIIDFADRIKDAIAIGDWFSVGYMLGEQLAKTLDNINWNKIRGKAREFGKNFANLINGFISFPKLGYKIGNAIAQALNTAFDFVNSFVTTLDWAQLGIFIGEMITGAVQNFEWGLAGNAIGTLIGGLIQALGNAIANADIGAIFVGIGQFAINLAKAISDKIRETPWTDVGLSLGDAFYALIFEVDYIGLAQSLLGLFLNACSGLGDIIAGFFRGLAEGAGDGFLGGIFGWASGIATWLNDNLWQPLYNALLTLFGIEGGNSTQFKSIGEYSMMGLLEGLGSFIWDILDFFGGLWNDIVLTVGEFAVNWGNAIEDWWNNNVAPWFTLEKWMELGSNAVSGLWNGLKGIGQGLWDAGAEVIGSFADALGIHSPSDEFYDMAVFMNMGAANGITETMYLVLNALKLLVTKIMELITKEFVINEKHSVWFFDQGRKMLQGLIDGFDSMMGALNQKLNELLSAVSSTMNAAAREAASAAASIAASVARAKAALAELSAMEGPASSRSNALATSGPSKLKMLSMDLTGFSIPKLATGDVAMPNNPYLALLGDNKKEQEVVSPLSTIEQAVRNVVGNGRNITVVLELDGREFGRAVYKANNQEKQRVGIKLAKGGAF